MRKVLRYSILVLLVLLISQCSNRTEKVVDDSTKVGWPKITKEMKPWTRWWWLGNTVTRQGLTQHLEKYKEAGIGGLEITPIYGVKGYEDSFIDFLSPKWMELLEYTLEEAEQINMGVDLANTSSWPFGGPWVGPEHAAKRLVIKKHHVKGGRQVDISLKYLQKPLLLTNGKEAKISDIKQPLSANDNLQELAIRQIRFKRPLPLISVIAYADDSERSLDISQKVNKNDHLIWNVPSGDWTLYAIYSGLVGKMVERAGPGGEGRVIDHLSKRALRHHLQNFDKAFATYNTEYIRAYFNDSYEVDEDYGSSNFTGDFFNEFQERRGYDLKHYLPVLTGNRGDETTRKRILCDYRETISDLLLQEFTNNWDNWAESQDKLTRNQAHGSPASILDLYGASDIPETEGTDIIRFKFASSAAHIHNKPLASAEACTWLDEHFKASLREVKEAVDKYFLGGINHIVYHGTPYSPENEDWPGWLFYAAVHFGPTNTFWQDFAALNEYVTRAQSFLQSGRPDNDILLYFPIYDEWSQDGEELLKHFDGKAQNTKVRNVAQNLLKEGYTFNFISDKQIEQLEFRRGNIFSGKYKYQTIVVPETDFIPLITLNALTSLARNGARIVFCNSLPKDVSGFGKLEKRQNELNKIKYKLDFVNMEVIEAKKASIRKGSFIIGERLREILENISIFPEPLVDEELSFVRRQNEKGKYYFLKNNSKGVINKWVKLRDQFVSALIYNPMNGIYGKANIKNGNKIYLQLAAGETCIIKTFNDKITTSIKAYPLWKSVGKPININGPWDISFIKGGPELPSSMKIDTMKPWTQLNAETYKNFSGTAEYTTKFTLPPLGKDYNIWVLDLGEVYESAEVILNGETIGTVVAEPYEIRLSTNLIKKSNRLTIKVRNLMANRIAYMDREGIEWKKFYNANVGASAGKNIGPDGVFSAKGWEPLKSGIEGTVKIIPMNIE